MLSMRDALGNVCINPDGIRFMLEEMRIKNPAERQITIRKVISYLETARVTELNNKPLPRGGKEWPKTLK